MKVKAENGEVIINLDYATLLEDEALTLLITRYHAYESNVLNCLAQIATTGQVDWNDGEQPWRSYWTGPGETFEKLRVLISSIANPTAQKLIADLKSERDKQDKQITELRRQIFELERESGVPPARK